MDKLVHPRNVWFAETHFWIELSDGRILGVPLDWFPRLLNANPEQRQRFELAILGVHWPDLDEDISIDGLLAGRGDMTRSQAQREPPSELKNILDALKKHAELIAGQIKKQYDAGSKEKE